MTTGSWNRDGYTLWGGSVKVGIQWSRTWAGADGPPKPTYLPHKYRYVVRREYGAPGKGFTSYKTLSPAYIAQLDAGTRRPPKRGRFPGDHAYHMTETRLTEELIVPTVTSAFPAGYPVMWAHGNPSWAAVSLLTANDQIRLVNKLREKLQGSDFNMSVFLGEGHQTLKLLADSAIRIAKAGVHAKKGDFTGAARALWEGTTRAPLKRRPNDWSNNPRDAQQIANNWLELQYGWRPLLQDAAGAAEMLAHHLSVPAQSTYRVAVRREVDSNYRSQVGTNPANWADSLSAKVHRRSLIARITETPSTIAKLGLLDPELVIWELMPFSFVADWFIPIGSWMEARASAGRLKGLFITSDKQTGTCNTPVSNWFKSPARATYKNVVFDRSISSSLQVPMPSFKPLDKVASWQHCANALALVTQVFTGSKVRK